MGPDLLKGTLLQIWDHAWEHAKLKENTMKVLTVQYYKHSCIVLGIWEVIQWKINTTKLLFWDVLDSCSKEIQRANYGSSKAVPPWVTWQKIERKWANSLTWYRWHPGVSSTEINSSAAKNMCAFWQTRKIAHKEALMVLLPIQRWFHLSAGPELDIRWCINTQAPSTTFE